MNNTSCSVSTSHTSFQPSMLQASDHTSKQSVVELIDVLMKNKKKTEAKMTQVLFLTVTYQYVPSFCPYLYFPPSTHAYLHRPPSMWLQ